MSEALSVATRSTETRTAILRAAAVEFNANGITPAALGNIAKNIGLTRGAIYSYFDDHSDLLTACYEFSCDFLLSSLAAAKEQTASPLDTIARFVEIVMAEDAPEVATVSELALLNPTQHTHILARHAAVIDGVKDIIEDGIRQQQMRRLDSYLVSQIILGYVSWPALATRWSQNIAPIPHSEIVVTMTDVLLRGSVSLPHDQLKVTPSYLSRAMLPATSIFDPETVTETKREALLARGSWLFNQKGIDSASLDTVAEHYGVSKAVIYHNVGKKNDFVTACYRRAFEIFRTASGKMVASTEPPSEAIATAIFSIVHAYLSPDISPLAPTVGFGALAPEVREEMLDAGYGLFKDYSGALTRAQDAGHARALSVTGQLILMPGLFEWTPKWRTNASPEETVRIASEIARFWAFGLAAEGH